MSALVLGGTPVGRMERMLLLYSYHGRRRHERRRKWDKGLQQQEEDGRVSITVEDVGRGAKDSLRSVARMGNEWRANLVSLTSTYGAAGVTSADCLALGALCVLLVAVATKAAMALSARLSKGSQRDSVVRRDRSLGGREVVVGNHGNPQQVHSKPLFHLSSSSSAQQQPRRSRRPRTKEEVPAWWSFPTISASAPDVFAQAEANALVRAIVNKRLGGVDFNEEDAVQVDKHSALFELYCVICRHSGARLEFGTENTRDALFRAAVGYVLSACSGSSSAGCEMEYHGESMVSFVCGLAANMNLEPARAASIVNAAVAARTRAGFLQAWASFAQGNVDDAMSGIKQLVCMHQVFPPGPNSPHMDMVGRGLESHLSPEERLELFEMYAKLSPHGVQVALDALSLPSRA